MKKKLGIEEDILIERAHCTEKIQRNDGTRNKKRTIVVKFLNFLFFFLFGFSFTNIHDSRDSRGRGRVSI